MPDQAQTPAWAARIGRLAMRRPGIFTALARLETRLVDREIAEVPVERPVFIAGMARAGTTLLLELVSRLDGFTSHCYADFPFVHTPFWWRSFLRTRGLGAGDQPVERLHKDGLTVTAASPEALEEILWRVHLGICDHLEPSDTRPGFERELRAHMRKLLAVTGANRYVSKNNYNLGRLTYLARVFPDAAFVLPVRAPAAQIASLIKQDRYFTRLHAEAPATIATMRAYGHDEFGPGRRVIRAGPNACADQAGEIEALWHRGEEVRGWARYWAMLHARALEQLAALERGGHRVRLIRCEDLCAAPQAMLATLKDGLEAADSTGAASALASTIAHRDTAPAFSAHEWRAVAEETDSLAERLGYPPALADEAEAQRA